MNPFYLVILDGPYCKENPPSPWISENLLHCMTREKTIGDIYNGQIEGVERVLLIDPGAGTTTDASADIAREVAAKTLAEGYEPHPSLKRWLEFHREEYFIEDDRPMRRASPLSRRLWQNTGSRI